MIAKQYLLIPDSTATVKDFFKIQLESFSNPTGCS